MAYVKPCIVSDNLLVVNHSQLPPAGTLSVPAFFVDAASRFVEFFTAEHRNPNTRAAYAQAVRQFTYWAEGHGLRLNQLTPVHVASYIEQLGQDMAPPTVKQHLAAIRTLFDYLVRGGACRGNPAISVRGPKHVVMHAALTNDREPLRVQNHALRHRIRSWPSGRHFLARDFVSTFRDSDPLLLFILIDVPERCGNRMKKSKG
jgi:Phage integrase, N-terminal SAM-like domain